MIQAIVFQDHTIKGRDAQKTPYLMFLYRIQNGIDLRDGHDDRHMPEFRPIATKQSEGHDVEKRVDCDVDVSPSLRYPPATFLHHIPVHRTSCRCDSPELLWETRCPTGIEDIANPSVDQLDIHFWRVLEHVFKGIYILVLVDVSFGNFVEEESYGSFPERRRATRLVTMTLFQAGFWNYLFHVAEIGIQADNGLWPRSH